MFWVQDKYTKQLYKVFGMQNKLFLVWTDNDWCWVPMQRCEPSNPALFVDNLIDNDDKKFTHYYVSDD